MDSMLLRIISEFKLGQSYVDNHLKAHQYIGEILRDFNFVYGLSPEVMIEKKITHKFFPHGLGHSLGIQVHDVGGLRSRPPADHPTLRNTQELSVGHVFTVEPGLYFIDMLLADLKKSSETEPYINWNKVDKFKRYGGIRIEDNVIVQANQFENVTRAAYQKI
jgi:Xaa-Pro dipeptidase